MTIGELLKFYRTIQKKTQKQWSGEIISPSFYAKVEKNISRISADDLLQLLHYNRVPIINFFNELSERDKSFYKEEAEFDQLINEAYYQNSKKELIQISELLHETELPNKADLLLLINTYIAILNDDVENINNKMINRVKEKVFNVSNFDVNSLSLYVNFMSFYNLDSNLVVSKKLIKQFLGINDIKTQKLVLSIIINMLVFCIKNSRFEEIQFFVDSSKQIKTKPEIFFYKEIIPVFDDIMKYHYNPKQEYLDNAETIIKSISLAGMKNYSRELQEFLNNNS